MKEASEVILSKLTQKGYRITNARKYTVQALVTQTQPITIQSLAKLVNSDQTSVYRTVAMLLKEKIIEEVVLTGEVARYALSHGHHHHAVCTSCGFVAHVLCESVAAEKKIPKQFAYINEHEVTLYGLCTSCAHT